MEFLFVGSRQQLSKVQLESVTVQDSEISVRNLGACLMGIHVSKVCSKALRDLYSIRHIRKYLSEDATKVLSLLYGESLGTVQLCTIHKEVLPPRFQWKCGGGGGEKAIEMWRWWWWWRETG